MQGMNNIKCSNVSTIVCSSHGQLCVPLSRAAQFDSITAVNNDGRQYGTENDGPITSDIVYREVL